MSCLCGTAAVGGCAACTCSLHVWLEPVNGQGLYAAGQRDASRGDG